MGAADRPDAGLGQPEVVDLAGLDELLDGAGDVLDGDVGVDAVLVEQVDGVGAQTPQRAVDRGADVVGPATDPALMSALVEREAKFRRDDDLVADRLQGLTNDLLVRERPVTSAVSIGSLLGGAVHPDRGRRGHTAPPAQAGPGPQAGRCRTAHVSACGKAMSRCSRCESRQIARLWDVARWSLSRWHGYEGHQLKRAIHAQQDHRGRGPYGRGARRALPGSPARPAPSRTSSGRFTPP